MRRVVIHAGLPKTGSTSIQRFLDGNAKALREQGILYSPVADRRGRRDHNFLAMAFWKHVQRIYADKYGDDLGRLQRDSLAAWHKLLEEFRSSDQETLIISGEFFTRSPVKPIAEFAKAELSDFELTVMFYLRQPSAHYVSWTQQHIRGSNSLLPFTRNRSRWSKKLGLWRKVGDVVLREFDRRAMVGGDVVLDFASVLGADIDALDRPADANESISAEGMELLLKHRRFHFADSPDTILPQTRKLLERIRRREQALSDEMSFTKPKLLPELATYMDSDTEELARLEKMFGFRYSHLHEAVTMPDGGVDPSDVEGREFRLISDLMPVDSDVRDRLQHQLELAGVKFS